MSPESEPKQPPAFRVLIVDDDELVRRMLATALQRAGWEVLAVDGGAPALAVADQGWHLALIDRTMPGIDGLRLGAELRARHPNVRLVLFTGGDTEGDTPPPFDLALGKPIRPAKLIEALRVFAPT